MKILVTGASGFIGGHLVDFLGDQHRQVRCFRHEADQTPDRPTGRDVEWVRGDLKDGESCGKAVQGCDLIVHLGGLSRYDARVEESEYWRVNVDGTRALLEACRAHHAKTFLYISSIEAVGLSIDGRPLTEVTPPRPRNIYGRSKLEAE